MTRQGTYITNLSGKRAYQSFKPAKLPMNPPLEIDEELMILLGEAYHQLGKLDGASSLISNIDLYISMYIRKESLLSTQIEGTQATIDDIFDPFIERNLNPDLLEVFDYIHATHEANILSKTLPVSNRFIKLIHQKLLSSSRGFEKDPGEFRRTQNWIGPKGSTLANASYIPPNVSDMNLSMSELEEFIHYDEFTSPLIKIALAHYQFETIHPFLDGNGRMGRLLINILLKEFKILSYDTLYISYFLKQNRVEYYDRLMDVRKKGHYEQWVKFFLRGIIASAEDSLNCINKLVSLHQKNEKLILLTSTHANKMIVSLYEYIEKQPIIDIGITAKALNKSYNTIAKAVNELVSLGILKQVDQKERNRIFVYEEYLSILRKGTE